MSVIGNPLLLGGDAGTPSYTIDRSVRLRSSASAYFNRTPASVPTSYRKTTISFWAKNIHKSDGDYTTIYSTGDYNLGTPASRYGSGIFFVGGKLYITEYAAGTTRLLRESNALFRDPSAWYHFVISIDSTLPQGNGQCTVWCNNELLSWTTATNPTQNTDLQFQSIIASYIGTTSFTNPASKGRFLDGYLTEVNFIDGQALTPSAFGEYDSVRNTQWKPKAYSGSWGTNGFYLKFADNSAATAATIGKDSSGNGNNWTPNGISVTAGVTYDSMTDVPTLTSESASNFAVMNPLNIVSGVVLAGGNLNVSTSSASDKVAMSTITTSDTPFYVEMQPTTVPGRYAPLGFGVRAINTATTNQVNYYITNYAGDGPFKVINGVTTNVFVGGSSPYAYAANTSDVFHIACDPASGKVWLGKNNSWFDSSGGVTGNPATGANPTYTFASPNQEVAVITSTSAYSATDGSTASCAVNFGQRPFAYTPPAGFKRLNTYNLPEPAVASSDDYHKVYTYTGNGGGLQVGEIQKPLSLYNLDRSLRFKGTNSYFDKVFASGGANTKGTLSMWVKRGKLAVQQELFRFGTTGTLFSGLYFSATDTLNFVRLNSTYQTALYTTKTFRDPLNWIHIVVAWDTTLATTADRVKIYVNGTQETVFSSATYPTQNLDMYFFTAGTHNIGRYPVGGNYFGGYMAEFHAVDGTQLTANDFGQFDGNYYWTPKDYTGGYGTNGWHLDFEDYSSMSATGIGKDVSGLGNNFTPYNFDVTVPANTNVAWDSMVDVPTLNNADVANFATWSPFNTGQSSTTTSTLSNGNLLATGGAINTTWSAVSTIVLPTTGKWYFEAEMSATSYGNGTFGIFALGSSTINAYAQLGVGTRVNDNVLYTYTSYNTASPNRIGIAYDADNGLLWQTDINGNWLNSKVPAVDTTGLVSGITKRDDYVIGWRYNSGAETNRTCSLNCGQKPFFYTPPTGFKSLNSFNVAEVTGDLESPDFVWIKSRSAATNHALFNSVTGVGKYLSSNATTAETTDVNSLIQFNKNGFLLGNSAVANTLSATYVASAWKIGGSIVTNNAGTIASQVRANPTAGISVVTYTGNNTASQTVGHGLGAVPKMVIIKGRLNAFGWSVQHYGLTGGNNYLALNTTAGQAVDNTQGAITNATLDVFQVSGSGGASSWTNAATTYEAFCFSEVAGFSKFGSYTGNADGAFVHCGFQPRWVMIKNSSSAGNHWIIVDTARNTYNLSTFKIGANVAVVENESTTVGTATMNTLDITSNGFKLRSTNGDTNGSGTTYIYAAFAEHPFKYSLAR